MDDNTSKKTAVFSMLQTKSGELWFGTTEGMYCYNGISFYRFLNNNIINRDSIQLKTIEAILEDRNGNIWFGSYTGEGICRFDGKYLTRLEPNVKNLKFDYVRVMCIIEDKNGDILFGTGDGAYRYNGITLTNFAKEAGVHWVYNIIADKKENLWFATEMGGGKWAKTAEYGVMMVNRISIIPQMKDSFIMAFFVLLKIITEIFGSAPEIPD